MQMIIDHPWQASNDEASPTPYQARPAQAARARRIDTGESRQRALPSRAKSFPAPACALISSDDGLSLPERHARHRAALIIHRATGHLCVADYLDGAHPARQALVRACVPETVAARLQAGHESVPDLFSFDARSGDWRFWRIDRAPLPVSASAQPSALDTLLGNRLLRLSIAA
ncbi:MAG: hypothetical protein R3E83_22370 [Burkholderiaceae bacterium]